MAPMWYHYGTVKDTHNYFYKCAVVLNGNIYLLGIESQNLHRRITLHNLLNEEISKDPHQIIVSKMDLQTLKTTEFIFMPINYNKLFVLGKYSTMCAYGDDTLFGPFMMLVLIVG
ncbi:hypothetical protein CHUAL_010736 [Chamberlinius hualienensis]